MTRFRLCGLLLAVLLAWAVDVWLKPVPKKREVQTGLFPRPNIHRRERKPSDECSDYAPEKAHPTWFTCPIAEQRWREM